MMRRPAACVIQPARWAILLLIHLLTYLFLRHYLFY